MAGFKKNKDTVAEQAISLIFKSKSESRVYLFLLSKKGSLAEEIITGTGLHSSTVRDTLSKMYDKGLISRAKLKNDSIGKNPFIYYAVPPMHLVKKHIVQLEEQLNQLMQFASMDEKIQISFVDEEGDE